MNTGMGFHHSSFYNVKRCPSCGRVDKLDRDNKCYECRKRDRQSARRLLKRVI